jgi:hypothetical protein
VNRELRAKITRKNCLSALAYFVRLEAGASSEKMRISAFQYSPGSGTRVIAGFNQLDPPLST